MDKVQNGLLDKKPDFIVIASDLEKAIRELAKKLMGRKEH